MLVPLPLQVTHPARLVDAAEQVNVTVSPEFLEGAGIQLPPVSGAFLGPHEDASPTLVGAAAAMLSSRRVLGRRPARPAATLERPEVVAAITGLGLSAVRVDAGAVPVAVTVGDGLEPASVAVALHLFDTTSTLDVARGRRVVAIGRMQADQQLVCPPAPAASIAAAQAEDADVVVVPSPCGDEASGDTSVTVHAAGSLAEAVDLLVSG